MDCGAAPCPAPWQRPAPPCAIGAARRDRLRPFCYGASGRVLGALVVEVELRRGLGAQLVERPGRHHRRWRRRWRGERPEGAVEAAEHRVDPGRRRTKRPLRRGLRAPEAQRRERRQAGVEEHVRRGELEPCVAPVLARALRDEGLADPRRGARVVADAERVHGPPARGVDRVGEVEVGEGPSPRTVISTRRVGWAAPTSSELRACEACVRARSRARARSWRSRWSTSRRASRSAARAPSMACAARVSRVRGSTERGWSGARRARCPGSSRVSATASRRLWVTPACRSMRRIFRSSSRTASSDRPRAEPSAGHDQRRANEHQRAPRRLRGQAHPERPRRREHREPVEHQGDLPVGERGPGGTTRRVTRAPRANTWTWVMLLSHGIATGRSSRAVNTAQRARSHGAIGAGNEPFGVGRDDRVMRWRNSRRPRRRRPLGQSSRGADAGSGPYGMFRPRSAVLIPGVLVRDAAVGVRPGDRVEHEGDLLEGGRSRSRGPWCPARSASARRCGPA